jgi:F-type H+-transporting ATPase subunit b
MSGWTLAFQIINFLVLAAVLQRFLFKPVTRIVAKRQQEIGALTAEAEKAKAAAEEARQRYERELAGTAAERERALALAREEAGKERERLVVQANQEAKALVDAGRATLEREQRDTTPALRADARPGSGRCRALAQRGDARHGCRSVPRTTVPAPRTAAA